MKLASIFAADGTCLVRIKTHHPARSVRNWLRNKNIDGTTWYAAKISD